MLSLLHIAIFKSLALDSIIVEQTFVAPLTFRPFLGS